MLQMERNAEFVDFQALSEEWEGEEYILKL